MDWQPIETAPQQQFIIIHIPDHGACNTLIAAYQTKRVGRVLKRAWFPIGASSTFYITRKPTHWMPMPTPPITTTNQ